jgi:predicted ATPase
VANAGASNADQYQPAQLGKVRTMVAQVAAKVALFDDTIATVVERTGGVPLFVEEMTRALLEKVAVEGGDLPESHCDWTP